jgi:hypothetical protein
MAGRGSVPIGTVHGMGGGWPREVGGGGEILVVADRDSGRRRGETRGGETFGISLRKVRGGRQRKGATIPRNKAQRNTGEEEEGGAREGAESAVAVWGA